MHLVYLTGAMLSLAAAVAIGTSNLLIRIGTQEGKAEDAVLIGFFFNFIIHVPLALGMMTTIGYRMTGSVGWFVIAGLCGSILGRFSHYLGIGRIGASRGEPLKASQPLFAALIAVLLLDETLTLVHFLGIVFIMGGVAYISWSTSHERIAGLSTRETVKGIAFCLAAAVFFGFRAVFARMGTQGGTSLLVGLAAKTTVTSAIFGLGWILFHGLSLTRLRRAYQNRWFLMGGFVNSLFQIVFYASLFFAPVVVAVPILQVSPLLVLIISLIFVSRDLEPLNWRLGVAATIVVMGAILVTIYSQ